MEREFRFTKQNLPQTKCSVQATLLIMPALHAESLPWFIFLVILDCDQISHKCNRKLCGKIHVPFKEDFQDDIVKHISLLGPLMELSCAFSGFWKWILTFCSNYWMHHQSIFSKGSIFVPNRYLKPELSISQMWLCPIYFSYNLTCSDLAPSNLKNLLPELSDHIDIHSILVALWARWWREMYWSGKERMNDEIWELPSGWKCIKMMSYALLG